VSQQNFNTQKRLCSKGLDECLCVYNRFFLFNYGPETKTAFRNYVKDDKVIRYIEDKKTVPANSKATGQLSTAYKLLKAYRTKDFAKVLCE
jgi:hypothetical protein